MSIKPLLSVGSKGFLNKKLEPFLPKENKFRISFPIFCLSGSPISSDNRHPA